MDVVCDLEANGLKPSKIWVIVCKDIETGEINVFHPWKPSERAAFSDFAAAVTTWIGHNFLGYDRPALASVLGVVIDPANIIDTLVVSRTVDATRTGPAPHSLEVWGEELGQKKLHTGIEDWSVFTPEMEERCLGDVETNFLLYKHLRKYILSPKWRDALETEHYIAWLCVDELKRNGFSFDRDTAVELKKKIDGELEILTKILTTVFPIQTKLVRECNPRATKYGTINRTSIPKKLLINNNIYYNIYNINTTLGVTLSNPETSLRDTTEVTDLSEFTVDAPFSLLEYVTFNPGSPKQRIDRLWDAGWQPINKTKGHKKAAQALRSVNRKKRKTSQDFQKIAELEERLQEYERYGWTTDEENLSTLPETAPEGIQKLVRWLLLNSRSNVLDQWITAAVPVYGARTDVSRRGVATTLPDSSQTASTAILEASGGILEWRVHGTFNHIQPWTHRMSHTEPNLGNVPKFNDKRPETTPYSDQMRALWGVRKNRLLVGVDAESIQLRIFGHYIEDDEFIKACVSGNKEEKTDPHSVNQRALGPPCKSRDDAKTFIYAWLLGAGIDQVAFILKCSRDEATEADKNFLDRYPGLRYIKDEVIPMDAERGYFQGFDGRYVRIVGDDINSRRHFALAGYLQNGEAVIMKRAVQIWYPKLRKEKVPFWWVNFVHDEWQTETIDDYEVAKYIAFTQADAIRQVGDDLGLRCPFAGSWFSEHGNVLDPDKPKERWAIGRNWMETH